MMQKLTLIGFGILAISSSILIANDQPQSKSDQAKLVADVAQFARQLDAPDPVDVEAAIIALSRYRPRVFPIIEAEANDPSLKAPARTLLKQLIERQRPWLAARTRIEKVKADDTLWNETGSLAAYEKCGRKDPRWDAAARDGIKRFTTPGGGAASATRRALEKAITAGCDDPFVLYLEARSLELANPEKSEIIQQMYDNAAAGMLTTPYPPSRKAYCYLRSFWHLAAWEFAKDVSRKPIPMEAARKLLALMDHGTELWLELLQENPGETRLMELSLLAIDGYNTNSKARKMVFDRIYAATQHVMPDSSMTLTLKGHFYVQYAWDARGGDWAANVTPEGWTLLHERLAVADEALTKAWEKDHNNYVAAKEMLTVELGQGQGRDRMELWYRRAMEANPDYREAVDAKMHYLQPKWHGTPQDMLAFAHEIYEGQNWYGELPFVQVQVMEDLLPYVDAKTFFATPQVWTAIASVEEPWLRRFPANAFVRSRYCYYAVRCEHWDIAQKQFAILGDGAVARQFGGEEAMKSMREAAKRKGAAPVNTP